MFGADDGMNELQEVGIDILQEIVSDTNFDTGNLDSSEYFVRVRLQMRFWLTSKVHIFLFELLVEAVEAKAMEVINVVELVEVVETVESMEVVEVVEAMEFVDAIESHTLKKWHFIP